jgi:hypothetical protein
MMEEARMRRETYTVKRRPGGWSVENGEQSLCCYRTQEQAIAHARQLGHDGWRDGGMPAEVRVLGVTGLWRLECVYGQETHPA